MFTDESTSSAAKSYSSINFEQSLDEIAKYLKQNLEQLNVLEVKLNAPTTDKEIRSWLNQFQKALKEIGIGSKRAFPAAHSINATECNICFHADDTINTIRYVMPFFIKNIDYEKEKFYFGKAFHS